MSPDRLVTWGKAGSGSLNPARAQVGRTPMSTVDSQKPAIGADEAALADGAWLAPAVAVGIGELFAGAMALADGL